MLWSKGGLLIPRRPLRIEPQSLDMRRAHHTNIFLDVVGTGPSHLSPLPSCGYFVSVHHV